MIVQASHRFPLYPGGSDAHIEHMKDGVRRMFADELVKALTERGGIVGPIHEEEERRKDWLFSTDAEDMTFTVYAKLTEMPEPENYRFMGGPADGRIGRTGGAITWRVPYLPPPTPGVPFDLDERQPTLFADYEREGDTQVYIFRGINR